MRIGARNGIPTQVLQQRSGLHRSQRGRCSATRSVGKIAGVRVDFCEEGPRERRPRRDPPAVLAASIIRLRLSTTVDAALLEEARKVCATTDSALVEEALAALLARHRCAEVDASYAAYDQHPLDEPDEWETWPPFDGRFPARERHPCSWGSLVVRDGRDRPPPVLVLPRDAVIPRHRRALVAPCTMSIRGLASEVVLEPSADPVPLRSAVNLDSVESVSTVILVERLGRLADARMREIRAALAVAVDCSI